MESNVDKSKQTPAFVIEETEMSSTTVGNLDITEPSDDEEIDLELDIEDENDDEEESVEAEQDEEEVPQKAKVLSKEQRKIQALKNQAIKLQTEKAELEKKLAEKRESKREEELASQYIDDGMEEREAKKRARDDIKQSNIEKQLEILMFEKTNRKVLAKYPEAENDLESIFNKVSKSGMTVEQVCRGLYQSDVPDRERRAKSALTESDTETGTNNNISKSIATAKPQTKVKLNSEQLAAKRFVEKNYNNGKPISDSDFLKYYPT